MFKSAFIVYLSSRESCWYFNDVFLSVVGEEYSQYRNSPFLEQHRCTYFLNVGVLTIASTMTPRPVMIPARTTMQESRQARVAGEAYVRRARIRALRDFLFPDNFRLAMLFRALSKE